MKPRSLGALVAGLLAVMPVSQAAIEADTTQQVMSDLQRAQRKSGGQLTESQLEEFVFRLFNVADEAETGAISVDALSNIMTIAAYYMKGEEAGSLWCETVERLISEHLDDDALVTVVFAMNAFPEGLHAERAAYLNEIATETHSTAVKGAVVFLDAEKLLEEHDSGATFTAHQKKVLLGLLTKLQTEFKDVADPYGRGTLGEIAEGMQFAFERLGVGKQAPDIVANDLDGVEFKLSDYRGKVVLLDFWGHW